MKLEDQIIDAVWVHPGITYYRLAILLRVDEADLQRTMTALENEGQLHCERLRTSLRWYAPDASSIPQPRPGEIVPGTRAWEALDITAKGTGSVKLNELAAQTPMNRAYAQRVMRHLEVAKLVAAKDTRRTTWTATADGRKRVADEESRQMRMSKGERRPLR